ncbi:MAG: hypothetical protein CM15mV41_0600 [Caudoviricetes sp.]|nr:MAG: hypothetical protein CM15mV41_0600 [Caudoviricetes sp.]
MNKGLSLKKVVFNRGKNANCQRVVSENHNSPRGHVHNGIQEKGNFPGVNGWETGEPYPCFWVFEIS